MLQGVYTIEGEINGFSEFMWLRENFSKKRVVHVDEANRYSEFALLREIQGGDGGRGGGGGGKGWRGRSSCSESLQTRKTSSPAGESVVVGGGR